MKKTIIVMISLLAFSILAAEGWKLDSDAMLSLTQSQFSDNWAGTELSNITWTATSTTTAQKQLCEWIKNKNTLKLAFGQTHLQNRDAQGDVSWKHPQKSTDKINVESLFQFTLKTYVDPYVSLQMDSQFLDEAGNETIFVNPMKFTESAGIMRTIFDREKIKMNVRLGGAVRELYNRRIDDELPVDGGLEFIADYKQILSLLNSTYNSKLTAYQALFKSNAVDGQDEWKALDVKWENTLQFKLLKALSLNLNLDFIYEKEKSPEVQWREVLGLGLSYTLF